MATCSICGVTFDAKRSDAKVCSSACRQKAVRRGIKLRGEVVSRAPTEDDLPKGLNVQLEVPEEDVNRTKEAIERITEPWIDKIRQYCIKWGIDPDDVPAYLDQVRAQTPRKSLGSFLRDESGPGNALAGKSNFLQERMNKAQGLSKEKGS